MEDSRVQLTEDIDIEKDEVKTHVNSLLARALESPFLTPYMAIERISHVLAPFHIPIPKSTFLDGDHGYHVFDVEQFGYKFGMNDNGEVVQKNGCDCSIFFEYQLNEDGTFDIFCEIVGEEDLEQILDDIEEEENTLDESIMLDEARARKIDAEDRKALRRVISMHRGLIKTDPENADSLKKVTKIHRNILKFNVPNPSPTQKGRAKSLARANKALDKVIKGTQEKVASVIASKSTKSASKESKSVKAPEEASKKKPKITIKRKPVASSKKADAIVKAAAKTREAATPAKAPAPAPKTGMDKPLQFHQSPPEANIFLRTNTNHPKSTSMSLYKRVNVGAKTPAKTSGSTKTYDPGSPASSGGGRDSFDHAWEKSMKGEDHYHPANLKKLHDVAHSELQKSSASAANRGDYDKLNATYQRRASMIKGAVHHYTDSAKHDDIMKNIHSGNIEPDHIVLNRLHQTAKTDHALGKIGRREYNKRVTTINKLSNVVHGETTKYRLPGANPDGGIIGRLLAKAGEKKTPVKTFSEETMKKALEIMNKKVL